MEEKKNEREREREWDRRGRKGEGGKRKHDAYFIVTARYCARRDEWKLNSTDASIDRHIV